VAALTTAAQSPLPAAAAAAGHRADDPLPAVNHDDDADDDYGPSGERRVEAVSVVKTDVTSLPPTVGNKSQASRKRCRPITEVSRYNTVCL